MMQSAYMLQLQTLVDVVHILCLDHTALSKACRKSDDVTSGCAQGLAVAAALAGHTTQCAVSTS